MLKFDKEAAEYCRNPLPVKYKMAYGAKIGHILIAIIQQWGILLR